MWGTKKKYNLETFKTFKTIADEIMCRDVLTSIYTTETYHYVLVIFPAYRYFLRFSNWDLYFQFKTMLFRLALAAWMLNKWLCSWWISRHMAFIFHPPYLELFLYSQCPKTKFLTWKFIIWKISFQINHLKSQCVSYQVTEDLKVWICSLQLFLPVDEGRKFIAAVKLVSSSPRFSVHDGGKCRQIAAGL